MLRNVRNCIPGFRQVFGGFAANSAHGDALDFAPLGEVRKLRLREVPGPRRCLGRGSRRRQQSFGVSLHIVFTDTPAGACTLHLVDVNAKLTRKSPHMRSRGNGLAMFGARNFSELRGHAERLRCRLRLVGRKSLFFRLALGANRCLKC